MEYDFIELGTAPVNEDCVQVRELSKDGDYHEEMKRECRRYKRMLEERFPNAPEGAYFRIKTFIHDFGSYYEVCINYHISDDECIKFALFVENNLPDTWNDAEVLTFSYDTGEDLEEEDESKDDW